MATAWAPASRKRTSKGRQKIDIKPIQGQLARQVCFCKRRASVFKKANELSTLCGADVAVIVFSPSGKPFSFGHPSVHSIVSRFLSGASSCHTAAPSRQAPADASVVSRLHRQLEELAARLEEARGWKQSLEMELLRRQQEELRREGSAANLLNANLEELGLPELKRLRHILEKLRSDAWTRAEQLKLEEQTERRRDSAATAEEANAAAGASAAAAGGGYFAGFFGVAATPQGNVLLPLPIVYWPNHGFGGFPN